MPYTLRSILLAATLFSTQAAAVEFSFVTGNPGPEIFGNTYVQTLSELSVTASAWSTTGRGDRYETAELEIYNGYGMGVCNRDEGVNCSNSNNMHALDNKGADDLILFSFSAPVKLASLTLQQFGGDSDLSLWAGAGNLSLAYKKTADLGSALTYSNSSSFNTIKAVDLSGFTEAISWLAVSARINQSNDFIKLRTLNVQTTTPVPEADTWAMLLAGLGLVGFATRRRI